MSGGAGIGGNLYVGNSTSGLGNLIVNATTASSSSTTGALKVSGGVGIGGNLYVGNSTSGNLIVNANTTSSSSTSGALVVGGGVGITGNLNIGTSGIVKIANTTTSSNSGVGALVVSGGIGVSSNSYFGNYLNAATFNATSDYRVKSSVTRLNNDFSVDKLEPVFYYNNILKNNDIGFIAHKVQEIYPYLVNGEKDGENYQSLNYNGIIGILVHEIQELKKTVGELKEKMNLV